jgi:alpha-tubulin suppressor-like RCC1 family protein
MKPVALACLAVVSLVACTDRQPLQPPGPPGLTALIMDGAHHSGNADFFFLPPLASDPTGSPNFDPGKFNPKLSPTAEVCRLAGDPTSGAVDCASDNLGQPVLVFGPKAMALDVEWYQVDWDTKAAALDPSKFYRILVRGAPRGTPLGLLDVDPVTGGVKNIKTGEVIAFQNGRTLPIKVRIEQGAFGSTNPDHVEQVVPNRFTTPFLDVTTNTGFAGARLVDNWLPPAAVAAGIDRVVLIIERVPVNNDVAATSCLKSGLKELEGCYRFRTDPDLHQYGRFNTTPERPVIAGVCFEQPAHTDAPYEMFRREEAGEQELVRLEDIDAPFLNCATFSRTPPPPPIGLLPGLRSGRLAELASAGVRALMDRIGRVLTPRALHAVDLGAGGSTDGFSFFGWARRATLTKVAATDNQTAFVGTKVRFDPTVCLNTLHPATRPLASELVTFTVTGGGGTVGAGVTALRTTGSDGCASAPWVLGSTTPLAGNRLTATAAALPRTVELVATGVSIQVEAGSRHSCTLNAAGQAFCWGINGNGHLGDGTTTDRHVPTLVAGSLTFAALSVGYFHTCGLATSGTAYCWGGNAFGQVGDGTNTDRLVPTVVAGDLTFATLSAGYSHTCGVTTSGAAYCWGYGGNGHLGDGTTTNRSVPTPVVTNLTFTAINAADATCGVTASGAAYCWGPNSNGQLGDNTTIQRLVPTAVVGDLIFTALSGGVYHTCGVIASGVAYCWGFNSNGQLGDNTTTQRLVPTPVAGDRTLAAVSAGDYHNCGVTPSGAAYCWGLNGSGQLGDGTTTNRLIPTPVAGGLTFAAVSAGDFHTCGATTNGVAYCWGDNGVGQVGDGTLTNRRVPTTVASPGTAACDCWTSKASMPTVRFLLGVGVINGIVYAIGGKANNNFPVATVEAYDPATDTWTTKAPLLTPRQEFGVATINGKLYAVGQVAAVEEYDPVTDKWTSKASIPTPRHLVGVGVVNGIAYAVGGTSNAGAGVLATLEAYDPVTNTWTAKADMPTARYGVGVGVINGLLYAVGGYGGPDNTQLAAVEAYDPATDTWATKASLPGAQNYPGVGAMNGLLYSVGYPVLEAYDPATDTWTAKAAMPTVRFGVGVGVLNGLLYALGGATGGFPNYGALGTLEAYRP